MKNKTRMTRLSEDTLKDVTAGYSIYVDETDVCGCGCYYKDSSGGAATEDNGMTNMKRGIFTPIQ